jgi:hypothetical protein
MIGTQISIGPSPEILPLDALRRLSGAHWDAKSSANGAKLNGPNSANHPPVNTVGGENSPYFGALDGVLKMRPQLENFFP